MQLANNANDLIELRSNPHATEEMWSLAENAYRECLINCENADELREAIQIDAG